MTFLAQLSTAFVLLSGIAATGAVHAQAPAYPAKPMRIIVAVAAGGGVDTTARFIGGRLNQAWGQPVVVDNRPGAGGALAADLVAKAPPDGHMILATSSSITITPSIMKLPYDPLKDLLPVTLTAISPGVLVVHPSVPARNVKELIAFAKARPEQLFYSSSGQGSGQHLAMALLCQMTGVSMTHVPYKGTAPSIIDVVGGRIAVTIASVISTRPMFTTGKLRALAVVGPKRTPALPDLPTVAESGVPGFGFDNWYALLLPGATDKAVAVKLQEEVSRILNEPETRKMMLGQGLDVAGTSQEEFAKMYVREISTWAKVAKNLGMQAN